MTATNQPAAMTVAGLAVTLQLVRRRGWVVIEPINDTFKGQLNLEQHGGHTPTGVWVRIAERAELCAGIVDAAALPGLRR